MKKEKRFEVLAEESVGLTRSYTIIKDTQTGVQYLFFGNGYGGGLTPLLDKDGNPIIDKPAEE